MCVDVGTWRCRVGMFFPDHGAGVVIINFSKLMKIIGCVSFVRTLLIMSGIEQNPGPDTFTFRYQYLLVHIGTKVLRELFLAMARIGVGPFLISKSKDVKHLVTAKVITTAQKEMLLSVNKPLCITDLDITLLSCLLRNVCGLCPSNDLVWMNPAPTDTCTEADIARLRMCRNELMHSDKLRLPDAELKVKWNELSTVLTRLNQKAGIAQLQKLIDDAECMDIDEDLRNEHNETLKAWEEHDKIVDHGIAELRVKVKHEFTEVKKQQDRGHTELMSEFTEVKKQVDREHTELMSEFTKVKKQQVDGRTEVTKQVDRGHIELMSEFTEVKKQQDHGHTELMSELTDVKKQQDHGHTKLMSEFTEVKKQQDHGHTELMSEFTEIKEQQEHGHTKLMSEFTDVKKQQDHGHIELMSEFTEVKKQQDYKHTVVTKQVDRGHTELMSEFMEIKKQLGDIASSQQKTENQHVELTEIQRDIIENYKHHFKTLPVSPLHKNEDGDLLHMYQSPTMYSIEPTKKDSKSITHYSDIFCNEDKSFKHIFITGDAGVGKTSFCKHLCLLWSMTKCGDELGSKYKELQENADYISKFDYVFYISLRDTYHTHVLDMIIDQHYRSKEKFEDPIKSVLRRKQCLVLMDGMDEWSPKKIGRKDYKVPEKIYSERCVYIITCRPYRIESVRLSHHKDIDYQIQMTGISGTSSKCYIKKIIDCINKQTSSDKKSSDFKREINKCGLKDQLCIPLIASHLVVLWFKQTLTDMSRAVIYSNIIEMLFEVAKERKVEFPPCSVVQNRANKSRTLFRYLHDMVSRFTFVFTLSRSLQLPDSVSGLRHLNEYVYLLYKVCLLSYYSLYKQEDNVASLIFTREQLESEPYCFTSEETDFLCKIGLLSRNEVFGYCSVQKLKVSFIHKSYLEYFAALFISSFDSSNSFTNVTKTWNCLNDVLPFENLLLLLAGFSYDGMKQLFDNIYLQISDDLTLCRRNVILHHNEYSYINQLKSFQNTAVNCFKEFSKSKTAVLRLEDFIFDDDSNVDTSILIQLLLLNTKCVKSIHSFWGKYYPQFDKIHCLQYLNVCNLSSGNIEKFTQCMLQNTSTLNTVCIEGGYDGTLIPDLRVRNLHHLTSLSLSHVKMRHKSLHYLVKFLSNNFLIENIKLYFVSCDDHQLDDSDCTLTLNLSKHTKLTSLDLERVNILCNNVNNSSLKSITLCALSERIVRLCGIDLFNCIKNSQLEHLVIDGCYISDYNTMKTLTSTVKTLPCIKSLELRYMKLPDDVLLQLHPHVTQAKIELIFVTKSRQCFRCFVESCVNKKSEIKVELYKCNITSVDGGTRSELSYDESVKNMSEYVGSLSTINITDKDDTHFYKLCFETTRCQ